MKGNVAHTETSRFFDPFAWAKVLLQLTHRGNSTPRRWPAGIIRPVSAALLILPAVVLFFTPKLALADLGVNFLQVGIEVKNSQSLAWGDMDADGDLDLAVGNRAGVNHIYENVNGVLHLFWESTEQDLTESVDWGDWDGDGDLDLAVGNDFGESNRIYANEGGTFSFGSVIWCR